MSGYKLGIAIVVVLAVIAVIVVLATQNRGVHIGPPTEATAGYSFMLPIGLARTPHEFTPIASGSGAGRIYIAAYHYLLEQAPSRSSLNKIDSDPFPNKNPVILHLAAMLEKAAARQVSRRYILFSRHIPMPTVKDKLSKKLEVLMTAVSDLGEAYLVNKHPNKAKVVFDAVMSFGYRLWMHGLLVEVRSTGLGAMSSAITGLKQIYSAGALKSRAVKHEVDVFHRDLRTTTHKWLRKMRVIVVINPNPGDMANVVRHDEDLSWKLAAINELGFDRWATPSASQRQAIVNFLTRLEQNRNVYIKQAARNALSLTTADINQM